MTSLGSLAMYHRVPTIFQTPSHVEASQALQQFQFQQHQQQQQQQALQAAAHMHPSQLVSLFAAQQQAGPNPALAWSTPAQPNFANLAASGQVTHQLMMTPHFQQLAHHAANASTRINPNFLVNMNMARPMMGHGNSPPSSLSGHSTEPTSESSRTQSPSHASRVGANKQNSTSRSSQSPSPSCPDSPTSVNTIFPRRKAGQQARLNSKPVVLNEATLTKLFSLPLYEAAGKLGISATAMKSACRKLGIKKWPYRSVHSTKPGAAARKSSPPPSSEPQAPAPAPDAQTSSAKTEDAQSLSKDAALLANLFQQSSAPASSALAPKSNNSLAMLLN